MSFKQETSYLQGFLSDFRHQKLHIFGVAIEIGANDSRWVNDPLVKSTHIECIALNFNLILIYDLTEAAVRIDVFVLTQTGSADWEGWQEWKTKERRVSSTYSSSSKLCQPPIYEYSLKVKS